MDDIERKLRDLGEKVAREPVHHGAPRDRIVRRARLRRAVTFGAPVLAVALLAALVSPNVDWGHGERERVARGFDLAAAARATEDAGTARYELDMELDFGSAKSRTSASGVIDFDAGAGRIRLEISGTSGDAAVEVVTDGTKMFERPVASEDGLWYERDIRPFGSSLGPMDTSPDDFLEYVESVSSEVTRVGADVRRGVPLTRYRAVLDVAAVRESMRASGAQVPPELEVDMEPMDVWVDAQGRVREMTFGTTTSAGPAGFGMTMRGSMRLYDFGVAVDVELPDPDQVTDQPPEDVLAGEAGQGSTGATDDGSTTATFVTGRMGTAEPYVVVTGPEGDFGPPCVYADGPASRATIVDESTGEPFTTVTFGSSVGGRDVGCASHHDRDDFETLLRDPSRFTLRVVKENGQRIVVRLVKAAGPVEGEVVTD